MLNSCGNGFRNNVYPGARRNQLQARIGTLGGYLRPYRVILERGVNRVVRSEGEHCAKTRIGPHAVQLHRGMALLLPQN